MPTFTVYLMQREVVKVRHPEQRGMPAVFSSEISVKAFPLIGRNVEAETGEIALALAQQIFPTNSPLRHSLAVGPQYDHGK